MSKGIFTLSPEVVDIIFANKLKANKIGMHSAVTILIDCFGIFTTRTGFFPEYLEAACYIEYMHKTQESLKYPHLCFIDGDLVSSGYVTGFSGIETK